MDSSAAPQDEYVALEWIAESAGERGHRHVRHVMGAFSALQVAALRPPHRASFGAKWREGWQERLEAAPDVLANRIGHQSRDSNWRHASVRENHADITVAT